MPKFVKEYPDTDNLKNKFVIDEIAEDDPDLLKLKELSKIKLAIQKQKKIVRERAGSVPHPFITWNFAATTPAKADIDPTDRSISAIRITKVIPHAVIPIIEL